MFNRFVNTAPFLCATAGDQPPAPSPTPPPAPPAPPAPPPAPPAPAVAPWGADVNKMWTIADKPWFETLIPEGPTRELYKAKQYANPVVGADAYYAANKMINANAVEVPTADAKPEVWAEFDKRVGRPDAADKYDIKIGQDVKVDPALLEFGKKMAFELGLPPHRAQLMVDTWNKFAVEANVKYDTETRTANETEANGIRAKWGDKFDELSAAGRRVVTSVFDVANKDPAVATAEKGMLNKVEGAIGAAAMLELFARIGVKSTEGAFKGGAQSPNDNPDNMTPEQANSEITRLRADPVFEKAYTDANDPGHKAALEKMERLFARATPKQLAP